MKIQFYNHEVKYTLAEKNKLRQWIAAVCKIEKKVLGDVTYIFCTDEYLLSINEQFLHHDYFTDIITFDYSERGKSGESEIYISLTRVRENAILLKNSFKSELHRVMIHGILHLCGYSDKNKKSSALMRKKEDWALQMLDRL